MSPPVEPEKPRVPVLVPLLIAVTCVAVIGASGGYIWHARTSGRQSSGAALTAGPSGSASAAVAPAAIPSADPQSRAPVPAGPSAVAPPSPTRSGAPSPKNTDPLACRQELQDFIAAGGGDIGDAYKLLKVRTDKGTTAFICNTDNPEYYYIGSRDPEDAYWENGVNALLIAGVEADRERGIYVATVNERDGTQTKITVTKKEWRKENAKQPPVVERVIGN